MRAIFSSRRWKEPRIIGFSIAICINMLATDLILGKEPMKTKMGKFFIRINLEKLSWIRCIETPLGCFIAPSIDIIDEYWLSITVQLWPLKMAHRQTFQLFPTLLSCGQDCNNYLHLIGDLSVNWQPVWMSLMQILELLIDELPVSITRPFSVLDLVVADLGESTSNKNFMPAYQNSMSVSHQMKSTHSRKS